MQPEVATSTILARLEKCDILADLKHWHKEDLFKADAYENLIHVLRARDHNIGAKLRKNKGNSDDLVMMPIKGRQTKPMPLIKVPKRIKHTKTEKQNPQKDEKSSKKTPAPKPKAKDHTPIRTEIIRALIGAIATIVAGILGSYVGQQWPVTSRVPVSTATFRAPTEIPNNMPYPTIIPDIDLAGHSIPMHLVPAGKFTMGSDYGGNYGGNDGNLVHTVNLDAFYMDVYEVTNNIYEACVSAGACQLPKSSSSYTRNSYYANPDFNNYPVINVTWYMAISYCKWRGAQLPTEAQWEKAARGGLEGKSYPWGDTEPVCKKGADISVKSDNTAVCDATDTGPVGSYSPNGYSLYDMAGNVWEWTSSLYKPYPYVSTDGRENLELYGARVLRGGSWFNVEYLQRVSFRNKGYPDLSSNLIGFRCARNVTP